MSKKEAKLVSIKIPFLNDKVMLSSKILTENISCHVLLNEHSYILICYLRLRMSNVIIINNFIIIVSLKYSIFRKE